MSEKACSIDGCTNKLLARSWCRKHYYRWKRTGDPNKVHRYMDHREALEQYPRQQGDCLVWTGPLTKTGYGQINIDGQTILVHRFVWAQSRGPLSRDVELDHKCHNRACIRIDHLRIATRSQNTSNKAGPRTDNRNSGVRNVYKAKNGWTVQIVKDGVQHYFGLHSTIEEAASVAEGMRLKLFGSFAGKG